VRGWNPTAEEIRFSEVSEELAHLLDVAERDAALDLPRQLVHGDFWDNNVFFQDGRVVAVIDLDFMGERARIDDLALTLYYTNSKFSDGPLSDERIDRLRALVDAYGSGLDHPLSEAERAALPLALARTPLAFVGMIPFIDDAARARKHTASLFRDVEWALEIAGDVSRWQEGFV
jgi:homoserine kinase type II